MLGWGRESSGKGPEDSERRKRPRGRDLEPAPSGREGMELREEGRRGRGDAPLPTPAGRAESRDVGGSSSRLGQPAGSAAGPHLQLLRRPSPGSPSPRRLLPPPTSAAVNIRRPTAPARVTALMRVRRGPAPKGATAQLEPRPELSARLLECGGQRAAAGERCHFQAPVRAKTQL